MNGKMFHVHGSHTQYCKDLHATQSNLGGQCNPYQNLNDNFFGRNKKNQSLSLCGISRDSEEPKQNEEGQRCCNFKTTYKFMVLKALWNWCGASRQMYRPTEQDRSKPLLRTKSFQGKGQSSTNGENTMITRKDEKLSTYAVNK